MMNNFEVNTGSFKPLKPFKFWCQKVLPLVYDDSLSYYELLCKVVEYLNKTMEDVNVIGDGFTQLTDFVNNYFNSLDIQKEIDNKLDKMVVDGTLFNMIAPYVANISQPKVVDSTDSMTDKSYTYVLSTNGHIYQYNNGWVDTGLTYSVDLSNYLGLKTNSPTDLNIIQTSGVYFHGSSDPTVSNTPKNSYGDKAFMVVCYYQNVNRNYQVFYSYDNVCMYIRHQTGASWSEWINIDRTGGSLQYSNLNNITESGAYFHGTSDTPAVNTPNDTVYSDKGFMLVVRHQDFRRNYQMFFCYDSNAVFIRHQTGASWLPWVALSTVGSPMPNLNLDSITESGAFFHGTTDGNATNTPSDIIFGNRAFMVVCFHENFRRNYQMFFSYDSNKVYIRHQTGENTWLPWSSLFSESDNVTISKIDENNYSVNFGKYVANFWHNVETRINADLWNLNRITCNNVTVVPDGTDILGPIKETGQTYFMGGVHGYEKTTDIYITVDGVEWDYNTEMTGKSVQLVLLSELYRPTDGTHVYNRHAKITITNGKIDVESLITCVVNDSSIERATNGGLVAIRNDILKGVEMNNFFSKTPPTTNVSNRSTKNVGGTLYWADGSVTLENIIGKELITYSGYLQVFTNEVPMRNKIYLDIISSNKKMNNGEEILGKFSLTFA